MEYHRQLIFKEGNNQMKKFRQKLNYILFFLLHGIYPVIYLFFSLSDFSDQVHFPPMINKILYNDFLSIGIANLIIIIFSKRLLSFKKTKGHLIKKIIFFIGVNIYTYLIFCLSIIIHYRIFN